VPGQALDHRRRVQHTDPCGRCGDRPGVTNLATALGIKGRPVEEHLDQLRTVGRALTVDVGERLVRPSSARPPVSVTHGGLLVAEEVRRTEHGPDLAPRGGHSLRRRGDRPARLTGALALLCHRQVETLTVDLDPALARDLLGQVDREAVGVVQLEGDVSPDGRATRRQLRLEQGRAGPQRAQERLLLVQGYPLYELPVALQLGYAVAMTSATTSMTPGSRVLWRPTAGPRAQPGG